MSGTNVLPEITIQVEGHNDPISYSNLTINQSLADINSFSFVWRQPAGVGSLAAYINFNNTNLAKEVTINLSANNVFKGIICAIHCVEQDSNGITFEVGGKGLFLKLAEIPSCNTFYQKTITEIFNELNIADGTTLQLNPNYTTPLFYTVQYNQTPFDFYAMIAKRHGEWLYYNGEALVMGSPQGAAIDITDAEIENLSFNTQVEQPPVNAVSFNSYLGETINSTQQASAPGGTGFVAATMNAANRIISSADFSTFSYIAAVTQDLLDSQTQLMQKGKAAMSVLISGRTYNNNLKLADKLNITDLNGESFGEYIITSINHFSTGSHNYSNFITAIPAEVEAPPYTNPLLYPVCPAQMAIVIENEDPDHHDRIKVRFPWQLASETTPWLKIVNPYAGADHGFRFLPEVDDLVFVDFINNNPEFPFVLGSFYTDNRQSGPSYQDYRAKVFGTVSGRRMEINDETKIVRIYDNLSGETPINNLALVRDDSHSYITMQSQTDNNGTSLVFVNGERGCNISVMDGDESKLEIVLNRRDNKITIKSAGDISLNADGDITMSASNINLNASQKVKVKGTQSGTEIKGMKVEVEADTEVKATAGTQLKLSGLAAELQGNTTCDVKGGPMVNITGAIVKIN